MDWGKVLSAANLIVSIDNAATLHFLQKDAAKEADERLLIDQMRKLIFQLKQTAETVIIEGRANPKMAAAAMRILEQKLKDTRISPDTFRELSDKEYAYATIRTIREHSHIFYSLLSPAEQDEVNNILAASERLVEYDFYLSHYSTQLRLNEAQEIVDAYQDRNKGCLPTFYVLGIPSLIAYASSSVVGEASVVVWLITFFVMSIWYFQWAKPRKFAAAQKTLDKMADQQVWKEQFMRLHRRFGSDLKASALQKADKDTIRAFFKNSNLLLD